MTVAGCCYGQDIMTVAGCCYDQDIMTVAVMILWSGHYESSSDDTMVRAL